MHRLSNRVEKLEREGAAERMQLVHVYPGDTEAAALKAYKRAKGEIEKDAPVIFIRHSFKSAI